MSNRPSTRRRTRGGALVLAGTLLIAACGGGDDADDSSADTGTDAAVAPSGPVVISASGEPESLDPHRSSDPTQSLFMWEIYESLTSIENGEVLPLLATELPTMTSDTTWEVSILDDVVFSDGSALDAADVKYSLDRISNPDYGSARPEAKAISGTRVVDDHTVEISTPKLDPLLPNKLGNLKIMPEGKGDSVDEPVGSGPYMLESYDPGSQAVIVFNPEFRGEKPQVDEIVVKFIPDAETRIQALEAGEVDLVPNISPDDFDRVPKVITSELPVVTFLLRPNNYHPPFDDVRVRQALNYAIDREGIIETFFSEDTAVASPCQPGVPHTGDTNDDLEPYPYDPDKARELLEEAGAVGASFTFDGTTGVSALDREINQVIAQQLEEAGFKVELVLNDYTNYIERIYGTGESGSDLLYAFSTDSQASLEREVMAYYLPTGAASTFSDDRLTELVQAAAGHPQGEERQAAYDEMLEYACDEAALATLFSLKGLYGASDRIAYEPTGPVTAPQLSRIELVEG